MAAVQLAWRALLRCRYGVLAIAFTLVFALTFDLAHTDWILLEYSARVLLHRPGYGGGWSTFLHVYADMPKMQMGPPAILATLPTQLLNPRVGNAMGAFLMMLDGVLCVALAERAARVVGVSASRTRPVALIGGLVLLPLWYQLGITYMHVDDCIVLTALLAAIPLVAKRCWWGSALLLGTALATKPWAIVLVPLVFALPRRDVARAGLLTITTTLLWWAPFLIAAPETPRALGSVHVPIAPDSTYRLLGPLGRGHGLVMCLPGSGCVPPAASWMRPLQFMLGFALAVLVVRRGRWLAAPLVGLTARVLLDSQAWPYYGVGLVLAALVWDMTRESRLPIWTVLVLVAEYSNVVIGNDVAQAVIRLTVGIAVIWWLAFRRGDKLQPAGEPGSHDREQRVTVAA